MAKYGAALSSMDEHSLVISKTGMDKDLSELYSLLEGPHLLGFCKSGLIVEESLVPFETLT
jgi:acetolactate synthase-1/3 small subunit